MRPARHSQETTIEFTERELRYLMDRSLARLAFICQDQQAHIMPVLFEFDGHYFYLSGWNLKYSQLFQSVPQRTKVTLLIDDINSPNTWTPRGIEITGTAEPTEKGEYLYVRIKPVNKTTWGI